MMRRLTDPWASPAGSSLLLPLALRLVDAARRPLALLDVDPRLFRELLRMRLTLDLRARGGGGGVNIGLLVGMVSLMCLGFVPGIAGLLFKDSFLWMLLAQALLMGFLALAFVGDSSLFLVERTDIDVLSAHPVPDRTLYAVHLARVLFHLCAYVAAYVPMPMVLGVLVYPAWAVLLLFPLISLLSAVTSLAFVAVVYGVLLRVVGSAHFRRAALLLQIGSLVLFIGGMQVAMHSRELHELLGTLQDRPTWMLALPPAHSAGLFQLALGDAARQTQVLAALALVVPVIALLCALGLVSGRFLKGQAGEMAPVGGGGTWRRSPLARFGLPQSRGGSGERAGFVLGQALSRREPGLLAGALPGMIGMQVMGLVMGWRGMGDLSIPPAAVAALTGGLLASQLPFVLDLAQRSAHGEAAWLLRMSPLKAEQKILVGGVQGVLWGLYVPVILLGVLALTLGFGLGALPQVVLGYAASVLLGLVFVRRLELAIPFTLPSRGKHRSSGDVLIAMILNGLCVMPLAGVCGILALDPIATWVGLALVLPLLVRGYRRLREMQPRGLRSVRVPQARREVWS